MYISNKGKILTVGDNSYNGLGLGVDSTKLASITGVTHQVITPKQIVSISTSGDATNPSTIALSNGCPMPTVTQAFSAFTCNKTTEVYQFTANGLISFNVSFVDGYVVDVQSGYLLSNTGKLYTVTGTQVLKPATTSGTFVDVACGVTYNQAESCLALLTGTLFMITNM
jgi:flagellar basal body rod protein FlgG